MHGKSPSAKAFYGRLSDFEQISYALIKAVSFTAITR